MNPACELCRGACCESITLPLPANPDHAQWLALHGRPSGEGAVRLECQCRQLKNGKCAIYEERPQVCRDYEPGSRACLSTVVLRRPGNARAIFELLGVPE